MCIHLYTTKTLLSVTFNWPKWSIIRQNLFNQGISIELTYRMLGHITPVGIKFWKVLVIWYRYAAVFQRCFCGHMILIYNVL